VLGSFNGLFGYADCVSSRIVDIAYIVNGLYELPGLTNGSGVQALPFIDGFDS